TPTPFLRMLADRTSRFTSAGFAQSAALIWRTHATNNKNGSSAKSSGGILRQHRQHRLHDRCLFSDPSKDGWIRRETHGCGAALRMLMVLDGVIDIIDEIGFVLPKSSRATTYSDCGSLRVHAPFPNLSAFI